MNWLLYAISGALLMGASPVLAKSGMHKSSSHLAAALRGTCLFLSACVMAGLTGQGIVLSDLGQTSFLYLVFSGIATGIVWICLLRALQLGEVIKVVPVVEASAALNILSGIFLFNESRTWNKIIILVLLIAGTVMMGLKGKGRGGKSGAWLGYAIGAMLFTSVTVVLERIGYAGMQTYSERPIRYGVACVVVWLATFATKGQKGLRSLSFLNGLYLCLSGIVMGGAWYCFSLAFETGSSSIVELVERFDLVAAVFLGCVFMRERTTVRSIFGMIFMMLGFGLLLADLPVIPF